MFHAVGRTDITKLIVVCRNFANAPKNEVFKNVSSEFRRAVTKKAVVL